MRKKITRFFINRSLSPRNIRYLINRRCPLLFRRSSWGKSRHLRFIKYRLLFRILRTTTMLYFFQTPTASKETGVHNLRKNKCKLQTNKRYMQKKRYLINRWCHLLFRRSSWSISRWNSNSNYYNPIWHRSQCCGVKWGAHVAREKQMAPDLSSIVWFFANCTLQRCSLSSRPTPLPRRPELRKNK